ncbi:hypothetical protein IV203_016191 [Nitzschia inconspicua]|uniref:Uncharacterized protein n=1 Tax=Nitzschia inconspicua TaxID=303405 RepID=A0A9K3PI09_9STRA|nr:hypothetical protein IV203_016191 [Nitzschia inconspicua]
MMFLWTAQLLLLAVTVVQAERDTLSANILSKYWIDARDVLEELDDYQALWIKVHGCVWSECAIDNNDDDGENRDGDEQWYLARTQDFCANVAFSLYGIPKNHISLFSCSRGNYINSFFTYGGADTLLKALGKTPKIYYDGEYVDGYYNSNYGYNSSNSDCVVDEDAYMSSTMGCSAGGKFAIAAFEGEYCHGTDFYDIIDPFQNYNRQMNRIGCHKIWGRGFGNRQAATMLLSNSWSCDLDLYPNGCPDPYGQKARYDYALRAVAHGQSPSWAVTNMKLKRPLRILSWFMLIMGVFLLIFGYNVQNRERMSMNGGGLKGFFRVLSEDIHAYRKELARKRREAKLASKERRSERKKRDKKKKKKKKESRRSSSRGRRNRDRDRDNGIELSQTASSEYEAYDEGRLNSSPRRYSNRGSELL